MSKMLNNFGFRHKSGILLPVSALPSKYGIGSFGKSAYEFVDLLSATGTKCWQVLPMNPTSLGDSPYQSPSSVAGNPYFIDLDILAEKGLLTKDELGAARSGGKRIDYGSLFFNRYTTLRAAYERFVASGGEKSKEYRTFTRKNADWLDDYALFMALKEAHGYAAWYTWPEEHKCVKKARNVKNNFTRVASFWKWVQFEFDSQWQALHSYAKECGIVIIGDMPIYVAHDSMDVWQSPEQFLLDDEYNPTLVAGCPPDDFAPDGQLWGNPIYNWEVMKADGFSWWTKRTKAAMRLYDIIRIDHFRGFAGYYSIPYGHTTAREGWWNSAPGIELFRTLKENCPKVKIIAEDLGFITDDVRALLTDTGFPGMKMLQFAFFNDESEYLPRKYATDNCVVYTSSHDSDCTRSWCASLKGDVRRRFNRECPRDNTQSRTADLIDLAMSSRANLAIIPIQDYLEQTNAEGRINIPSVADGNWCYRLSNRYNSAKLSQKIAHVTKKSGRATKN